MFQLINYKVKEKFVAMEGCWIDSIGLEWLVCLYTSIDRNERVALFEMITIFLNNLECQKLGGGGDFNSVLVGEKR